MIQFFKWAGIILGSLLLLIVITGLILYFYYGGFGSQFPSGGKLSANQAKYDVHFYDINLEIDLEEEAISGNTTVLVSLKDISLDTLELDLIDNFEISAILINNKNRHFIHHDHKVLIPIQDQNYLLNDILTLKVDYSGQPPEALRPPWLGGFNWSKDSLENHWVGVSCQGEGAKIWFPCKDHPSDEPDSAAINITVPADYFVASNGLLTNESKPKPGYKTYHWFTGYPINNYLINIGIGKYKIVQKEYVTAEGIKMPVVFYVLPEMQYGADDLLEKAIDYLYSYRKYFGEYPWINEKLGLLNTDYAGMEHQTLIAYGNEYRFFTLDSLVFDKLLLHELGHEWWGNYITVGDWGDFWVQEGICTYGEALYVLDKSGEEAYHKYMQFLAARIRNRTPIKSPPNTASDDAYSSDIYTKGAAFMHTLRYVLGDSVFFSTLKQFATDSVFVSPRTVSTDDLLELVNKNSGKDWSDLFYLYLETTKLPKIKIDSLAVNQFAVSVPAIDFELPMDVYYDNKTEQLYLSKTPVTLKSAQRPIVDEKNWYLK